MNVVRIFSETLFFLKGFVLKVVIADCSATYTGRGDTTLSRGVRAIIIKNDGSVSIHNEVGNKPLNYMKTATFVESINDAGEQVWTYDSRKESLAITIHSLHMMTEMPLISEDPGLVRDGTEDQLQEWLSINPHILGEGFTLVGREYQTGKGPVDLLVLDAEGLPVVVEVKRVAMLGAVDQCRRYIDGLKDPETPKNPDHEHIDFSKVRGMVAGVDIRPKTLEWAEKHKIETVFIPTFWKEFKGPIGERAIPLERLDGESRPVPAM